MCKDENEIIELRKKLLDVESEIYRLEIINNLFAPYAIENSPEGVIISELIQKQAQMAQNLIEQQNMQMIQAQAAAQAAAMAANANMQRNAPQTVQHADSPGKPVNIDDELKDLSMDFDDIDENLAVEKLKNWIETN